MESSDFKRIILGEMHSVLKPAGFRKHQATFEANENDTVLFVQLQSSSKSTRHLAVVTVNLGIYSKRLAEILRNTHKPNILEAHWGRRIGEFLPPLFDKWWEVSDERQASDCANEIRDLLTTIIIPHMKSLASTEALKAVWETGKCSGITDYTRLEYLRALGSR